MSDCGFADLVSGRKVTADPDALCARGECQQHGDDGHHRQLY